MFPSFLSAFFLLLLLLNSSGLVSAVIHGTFRRVIANLPFLPHSFEVFNGKLHFTGDYYGIWAYDGTNAPTQVAEKSRLYDDLVKFKDKLYFLAYGDGIDEELWMFDGTNPPSLAAEISPASDGSLALASAPIFLTVFGDRLFFLAVGGVRAGREIWAYNGTDASKLTDFVSNGDNPYTIPKPIAVLNDKLYFFAGNSSVWELWSYDGINQPSKEPYDFPQLSNIALNNELVAFNNKLYFDVKTELWSYDGMNPPVMVADMSAEISNFVVLRDKLYFFIANDWCSELWSYDGNKPPQRVAVFPLTVISDDAYVFNDKLYYGTHNTFRQIYGIEIGIELWEYDPSTPCSGISLVTGYIRSFFGL